MHKIICLPIYKLMLNVLNIVSILGGEGFNTTCNFASLWLALYCISFLDVHALSLSEVDGNYILLLVSPKHITSQQKTCC